MDSTTQQLSSSHRESYPLIVKNLSVGYGSTTIIDTFSFEIDQPTFLAVIGLNGSGKTTFIKALSNKVSFSGQVSIPGGVAYLDQRNFVGFPIKVQELLMMGLYRQKHFSESYTDTDLDKVSALLSRMELEYLLQKPFNELSGGEQQLIWIGQTLLQDQPFIILDEPTQQLDLKNKKRVFNLLNHEVRKFGKTVICVTHDIHNLLDIEGKLVNFSKPELQLEEISDQTIHEHVRYLERV